MRWLSRSLIAETFAFVASVVLGLASLFFPSLRTAGMLAVGIWLTLAGINNLRTQHAGRKWAQEHPKEG